MWKKMTTRTGTVLTLAAVAMAILGLTTTSANAGVISYVQITNDADSGISAGNTYTHTLDFGQGAPGALINGVQFDAYNNAANGTLNFNREVFSGNLSDHAGNGGHNVSGSLVDLMTDMYYNGNNDVDGTRTWTLSGLAAGHTYATRIYTRQWGASDSRLVTFVFDPDGAGPVSDSAGKISQDNATSMGFTNGNDAYYINYQFKAVAGEDLVITLTQDIFNYSWHLYGLTNQIAGPVTKAYGPSPKDGALYEATWVTLGWSPGQSAVSHDVYLGDNFDDVNNDDGAGATFRGNYGDTMLIVGFFGYPYPDGLVPGTTYYWRVDEINDSDPNSPWKGPVWSFSVPPTSAYYPSPSDGGQYVDPDVELSWTAGFGAKLHYVHFGDNFDDVSNAVGGTLASVTTFTPGTLELGKTYYWRVDESNPPAATVKGDVWSFTTLPVIAIGDPDLVGWWKFDEGEGAMALDWSGHGNHGTFAGDPQWADGKDGGALQFDGSGDYISIDFSPELSLNDFTVSAWVNIAAAPGIFGILGTRIGSDNTFDLKVMATEIHGDIGDGSAWIDTSIDIELDHPGSNGQSGDLAVDTWYMIAYVIDGASQQVRLYLDGDLKRTITISGTPLLMEAGQSMRIGDTGYSEWMMGLIDDVRIYNKALTAEEIQVAMRGDLARAWNSSPANGSSPDHREALPLSWSAGDSAAQHDVYFGTDIEAVKDADASDAAGVYRGRQNATTYTPPEGVEWGGGPYYWRIDEYNTDATISRGSIWSFAAADFILVDDFESYNDIAEGEPGTNRIYLTWIDGFGVTTNGAFVGNMDVPLTERSNVQGGVQAMPLSYDNNLKTSEATLTLVSPRDWTDESVTKLSLWFRGESANAAERMYVALNGAAVVYHDDPAATQITGWTEWVIDLQAFAGVDLTNVNTVTIGFGTKGSPAAGGSGQMYFDDIRLIR